MTSPERVDYSLTESALSPFPAEPVQGWFKAFIQYAFYQVIAAAVVFIIANLILGTMNLQPNGTISTTQLLEFFPVLFITFLASIYALLKIPALTNHIFSGSSGGSSAGILEGMKP